MRKKVYLSLIILPLLVCLVMGGGAAYMLSYSIESSTHSYAYRWKKLQEEYPSMRQWLDSIRQSHALRDTTIKLRNGLRAHAFYLKGDSACGRTAICIHGYKDNALGMLYLAHIYLSSG